MNIANDSSLSAIQARESRLFTEQPSDYVRRVRSNSAYPALRFVVNSAAVVAITIIAVSLAVLFFLDISALRSIATEHKVLIAVGCICLAGFIEAAREAALVVVDISDTLIEAHRRK